MQLVKGRQRASANKRSFASFIAASSTQMKLSMKSTSTKLEKFKLLFSAIVFNHISLT